MGRLLQVLKCVTVFILFITPSVAQQEISRLDRERALDMMKVIGDEVRKHYYDPGLHGLNWNAVLEDAKQKIEKASTMNLALSKIAGALDQLNDSHTFFLPPRYVARPNYELQYQMVGDRCFVTRVRPNSDAEATGIKPGDEIISINGYHVNRSDLWKIQYVFSYLRPQPELHLDLVDPSGARREVRVTSKFRVGKFHSDLTGASGDGDIWDTVRESENQVHLKRALYQEFGDSLLALKIPQFAFSEGEVEAMIEKARKHQNLIVDLRGNPGGAVDTLKYLIGGVFPYEVKIADRKGRKNQRPDVSKKLRTSFTGKLVVLVDSQSASAAELFARVVQLEKRGSVVGDRSSGAVMESRHYTERWGTDAVVFYGVSITEWDLTMSDGKSLEHIGVTPDDIVLPSAQDLAAGRDPVLAHAADLMGVTVTAEQAGKAFPYEWPQE